MSDKYDEQIERLMAAESFAKAVAHDWCGGIDLFRYAAPTNQNSRPDGKPCGCLTMVCNPKTGRLAWTDELTEAIRADERLPMRLEDVTPAHLPVFAEWQRRLDVELERV